jgi:hypothetical protein
LGVGPGVGFSPIIIGTIENSEKKHSAGNTGEIGGLGACDIISDF